MTTVRNFPLITGSQNGYAQYNTTIRELSALAFGDIKGSFNSPPGSPVLHDLYIVGSSPSGAWASFPTNSLAYWSSDNIWLNYAATPGLILFSANTRSFVYFDGTIWRNGVGQTLGINTYTVTATDNRQRILITNTIGGAMNFSIDANTFIGTSCDITYFVSGGSSMNVSLTNNGTAGLILVGQTSFTYTAGTTGILNIIKQSNNTTIGVFIR